MCVCTPHLHIYIYTYTYAMYLSSLWIFGRAKKTCPDTCPAWFLCCGICAQVGYQRCRKLHRYLCSGQDAWAHRCNAGVRILGEYLACNTCSLLLYSANTNTPPQKTYSNYLAPLYEAAGPDLGSPTEPSLYRETGGDIDIL